MSFKDRKLQEQFDNILNTSPLSVYSRFFGSKPFSRTNEWLIQHGKEPIQW